MENDKKIKQEFFAAILTFAMAIGMIAPVNVAANDEYLNLIRIQFMQLFQLQLEKH